jgi:hypothetical protein
MPIEQKIYSKYFKNKTVQRSDKFLVTINENLDLTELSSRQKTRRANMLLRAGTMPVIEQYQVVNISIPNFEFKKEIVNEGIFPRSFPVFEHSGFEFSILFEDDAYGTIPKFVNWCQRRIIDDNGIYYPFFLSKVGNILFEAFNEQDILIYSYDFRDSYFLRATPITFDYTSTVGQKISITFGCDDVLFSINKNIKPR